MPCKAQLQNAIKTQIECNVRWIKHQLIRLFYIHIEHYHIFIAQYLSSISTSFTQFAKFLETTQELSPIRTNKEL